MLGAKGQGGRRAQKGDASREGHGGLCPCLGFWESSPTSWENNSMMEQCPLGVHPLAQRQGQGHRGPSSCVESMGASKPRLGSVQNLDHYPQGPLGREYGPSFIAQKKQLISLPLTIVRRSSPARLSDRFFLTHTLPDISTEPFIKAISLRTGWRPTRPLRNN